MKDKKFWSKNEDNLLLEFIKYNKTKNWNLVSDYVRTKNPTQCAYRYSKLISDMKKKKWVRKEDIKLIELVEIHGRNWQVISQSFVDKSKLDVEMRFKDKLNPNMKTCKFTEEEDEQLLKLYQQYGNDWYEISQNFADRNMKFLKKRFQTYIKHKIIKGKYNNKCHKYSHECIENIQSHHNLINNNTSNKTAQPLPQQHSEDNLHMNNNIFPIQSVNEENNFNIDLFFEPSMPHADRDEINSLDMEFFMESPDKMPQYSKQIQYLDDHFNKLLANYQEKCLEMNKITQNICGLENDNILNINSQVDNNIDTLIHQIIRIKENVPFATCNEELKIQVVNYIEMIIQIIHHLKVKVDLVQNLQKRPIQKMAPVHYI